MSDDGIGYGTMRLLIAFSLAFAGLLVYSLFDLLFLVLGSEGQATVTEVYTLPSRRGADPVVIEYKFQGAGGVERLGKSNLGGGAVAPDVGEQFTIQYLPGWLPTGPDGARPARPFNWIVLGLLGIATTGFGIFTYRAIVASGAEPSKPKRKRSP